MPISKALWQSLQIHVKELQNVERSNSNILECHDIQFDFTRHLCNSKTLDFFTHLAEECELADYVNQLQSGQIVNRSEQRAAWHPILRQPIEKMPHDVQIVYQKMQTFYELAQANKWLGFSGKPIKNVINIGIGGSHQGPLLACTALQPYHKNNIQTYFVANMDAADLFLTLNKCEPDETAFIIASKTFTTDETLTNANSAKEWLKKAAAGKSIENHFVAVTGNREAALAFGISPDQYFPIWDWVGGRFSIWSAIGLSVALSIGFDQFLLFCAGARSIDEHIIKNDWKNNIPYLMSAFGIWYRNFFHCASYAVLPYEHLLAELIPYLQQLEMESNGKSVDENHQNISYETEPIIWGGCGTIGQHAYHQWLHQSTSWAPVDFWIGDKSHFTHGDHHLKLKKNCYAQADALWLGHQQLHLSSAQKCPGQRPSTIFTYPLLTPFVLGQIIALYEYKIIFEGKIWNINSFDQPGVEYSKQLAREMRLSN